MLGLAAAAEEEEEEEGGREEAMACRFMCCLCLCKQSAGKGRTCSRLTLEMLPCMSSSFRSKCEYCNTMIIMDFVDGVSIPATHNYIQSI